MQAHNILAGRRGLDFPVLTILRVAIVRTTEGISAALMMVLTLILIAAVTARYVFHYPLTWSDDLVALAFIWLTMLGSVVAYDRAMHMRMTALVDAVGPRMRGTLQLASLVGEAVVFAAVLHPSVEHAIEESFITSPSLDISNTWRSLSIPVGAGLMLALSLIRLIEWPDKSRLPHAIGVVAAFVFVGIAGGYLAPVIGRWELVVQFVLIGGGCILLGFPIALAFIAGSLAYITFVGPGPLTMMASRMEAGMSHLLLLSIPGFVLLGALMTITGMARAMIDLLAALVGHIRGGLSYVMIAAMFLVSGISGSKSADMAAVAPPLFPEMRRRGGRPGEMVALLTATGVQTETVPPSLVLIAIGSVTTVSIQALFTGGLLPAFLMGLLLVFVVYIRSRKDPQPAREVISSNRLLRLFLAAIPALILPFIIRTAVVEGVATATEVATLGVVYAVLFGFVTQIRKVSSYSREVWRVFVDSTALSAAILFVLGGVTAMAFLLTQSGFSGQLVRWAAEIPGGATGFMLASILLFVLLGAVLEGLPAMVLFAPLMFPVAASLGIHQVHYAIVTVFAMGIGLYLPPFGVGYYITCAIAGVDPKAGMRPLMVYLAVLFAGLVLISFFPAVTTAFL